MRIWSIHPKYLDSRGLVALWREGLLAQKVLTGKTVGYKKHPQLERFKKQRSPGGAIASYLFSVFEESYRREYCFDKGKIGEVRSKAKIRITDGQLLYEFSHLRKKLRTRSPEKFRALRRIRAPDAHPIFLVVHGPLEPWEKLERKQAGKSKRNSESR